MYVWRVSHSKTFGLSERQRERVELAGRLDRS